MQRVTEAKIILVTRRTRLDELVVQYNSREQAKFYIEHMGADFADYVREHEQYMRAFTEAKSTLSLLGRLQVLDRSFVSNFVFGERDTVVALGQDGLVVNTAKYLDGQTIIGVNPDPARWDGVLLPFKVEDLKKVVPEVLTEKRAVQHVTMALARLNDGQSLYAVNDLFIGPKTHTSARYEIALGKTKEQQSSSGIIVSTGLGSTGWLKSVLAGARGIAAAASGSPVQFGDCRMPWDADFLYFSVREPFPSKTTAASLAFGKIAAGEPMILTSQMPENGVIFSDGLEHDFVQFNSGAIARIGVADKQARLVI